MKNLIAARRTTITREGWCYAIVLALVFAAALMQEVNLLVALSGMLAGPLLLSRFLAVFSLRGLQVRRKPPHGVCAGDLLVCRVALSNSRRSVGSWAVLVEEEVHRDAPGDNGRRRKEKGLHTAVFFPYLPAGRMRQAAYRGRLARRGRYRLGPLRVSTRFPFGLFCHTLTLAEGESLLGVSPAGAAHPRLGAASPRGVCRGQPPRASPRRRRRLLRRPPLAERRQPPLDSLADVRPGGKTRGAAVRAAAEPRRGLAPGPLAARPPRRGATARTSNWPSVSPPRSWPTSAAKGTATCI